MERLYKVTNVQRDTIFPNVDGLPKKGSMTGQITIRAKGVIDSPVKVYVINSSRTHAYGKAVIPAGNIDTTLEQGDFYDATCQLVYEHVQAKSGHLRFFIEYSTNPNDTLGRKAFPK